MGNVSALILLIAFTDLDSSACPNPERFDSYWTFELICVQDPRDRKHQTD